MPYKDYEKQKQNARENYRKNKEKKKLQSRLYYYKNWDEKQKYRANWIKKNKKKFKEASLKATRKWYQKNKSKRRAQDALKRAVKRGDLIRPNKCNICGSKGIIHAHHHKGYLKKFYLDVLWLCPQCHTNQHIYGVNSQSGYVVRR